METGVRILFIGEIVGRAGIYCVKALLPGLKRELGIDLTIAAAEGATGGFGIGKGHAVYLHKLGVDVITTGDFAYFKRDLVGHLAQAPYMLRPANYPSSNPGRGWLVTGRPAARTRQPDPAQPPPAPAQPPPAPAQPPPAPPNRHRRPPSRHRQPPNRHRRPPSRHRRPTQPAPAATQPAPAATAPAAGGGAAPGPGPRPRVGIITLLGQAGFHRVHLRSPYEFALQLVERVRRETPLVLVDFHATTTSEKTTMCALLDGKVSAIVGTHVRTLSADARLLPRGTAAITHSGRTGSLHSVGGLDPVVETRMLINQVHEQSRDAWGLLELQGVVLELGADGAARSIASLRRQTRASEAEQAAAEGPPQHHPRAGRRGDRRR